MQVCTLRNIAFAVVVSISAAGCGAAFNAADCRQAVVKEFNTTDVQNVSGSKYRYVVRDAYGNVWYAETMSGQGPQVTSKTLLFTGNKP